MLVADVTASDITSFVGWFLGVLASVVALRLQWKKGAADNEKILAEKAKIKAEEGKIQADKDMVHAQQAKQEAEERRAEAEERRAAAEQARLQIQFILERYRQLIKDAEEQYGAVKVEISETKKEMTLLRTVLAQTREELLVSRTRLESYETFEVDDDGGEGK